MSWTRGDHLSQDRSPTFSPCFVRRQPRLLLLEFEGERLGAEELNSSFEECHFEPSPLDCKGAAVGVTAHRKDSDPKPGTPPGWSLYSEPPPGPAAERGFLQGVESGDRSRCRSHTGELIFVRAPPSPCTHGELWFPEPSSLFASGAERAERGTCRPPGRERRPSFLSEGRPRSVFIDGWSSALGLALPPAC